MNFDGKKQGVLAVYRILKKYSDADHILTTPQIQEYLKNEYGLDLDRRTIYSHCEALNEFCELSRYEDNKKGTYLIDRPLEESEVQLLTQIIYASPYVSREETTDLINRLFGTQSVYAKKSFTETIYSPNDRKSGNRDFFLNISMLQDAIQSKKQVSLDYMKYNTNKELVKRKNEKYILHPYYIVFDNDRYYLLCKTKGHPEISHYRIDKMKNIRILDEKSDPLEKSFDPQAYARNKVFMHGGEDINVQLRCNNSVLDHVIEQFGTGISIVPRENEQFDTMVKTTRQGIVYWSMQYMENVEILSPENIRNEFIEKLQKTLKKYNKEG